MRSRVGLGMCRAEGASLRTADTVPADKPTCAATAFRVMRPFCAAAFLTLVIVFAIANAIQRRPVRLLRAHYRPWPVYLQGEAVVQFAGIAKKVTRQSTT